MHIQRVAIIPHLPPPPQPPLRNGPAISFHQYLIPFVQLLLRTAGHVLLTFRAVAEYCQRNILAIQVIFLRLVSAPDFDPTHPSFRALLDQLEGQVLALQKRIDQLDQKFWQKHLLSRDMADLNKLSNEVSCAYRQLNSYVRILERRTHPFPIQDQLAEVRDTFRDLDDQIDLYCLNKGRHIFSEFERVVALFSRGGIDLPKDIQQQLVQTWQNLESIFKLRLRNQNHLPQAQELSSDFANIREIMKYWIKKPKASPIRGEKVVDSVEPLNLRNIGNSCYLDSVLQAILCIDYIRDKLSQAPEKDAKITLKDYQKEVAIQQEILQFIDIQQSQKKGEQLSQMEFILFLMGGPSIHRLRDAIFKSEFHYEFDHKANLTHQHDAVYVMELLIDHFLADCKFSWRGHATTSIFPGLEFMNGGPTGKDEEVAILQVPLRHQQKFQKLDALVRLILGKHLERQSDPDIQRKFDPKDGIVIKGKEDLAAPILNADPKKVDRYYEWFRLKKLPPVLAIQFKRFTAGLAKDDRSVILNEDGILDLSSYYDAPPGESKKARYKIKSMVRHLGSTLKFGHYVADVEINGKYYHCNDMGSKPFEEISKREFFSRRDPYLLFLERISDDEVEEAVENAEKPKEEIEIQAQVK